jgi:hypothetical protein
MKYEFNYCITLDGETGKFDVVEVFPRDAEKPIYDQESSEWVSSDRSKMISVSDALGYDALRQALSNLTVDFSAAKVFE